MQANPTDCYLRVMLFKPYSVKLGIPWTLVRDQGENGMATSASHKSTPGCNLNCSLHPQGPTMLFKTLGVNGLCTAKHALHICAGVSQKRSVFQALPEGECWKPCLQLTASRILGSWTFRVGTDWWLSSFLTFLCKVHLLYVVFFSLDKMQLFIKSRGLTLS